MNDGRNEVRYYVRCHVRSDVRSDVRSKKSSVPIISTISALYKFYVRLLGLSKKFI